MDEQTEQNIKETYNVNNPPPLASPSTTHLPSSKVSDIHGPTDDL